MMQRWFPHFAGFNAFTPTLPKMYYDVDSLEQRYFLLCKQMHKMICFIDYMSDNLGIAKEELEELEDQFQKFQESGFDDYYAAQIEEWVNENLETLYHVLVQQVYFGLNEQGYFVAYIPESWSDIVFDTGADYALDTYGRLILRWDADSPYSVDQTPEVVRPWSDTTELEYYVRNIMNTLYSGDDNG